nr:hypothetical protein [Tanacetum cinerariifolium]
MDRSGDVALSYREWTNTGNGRYIHQSRGSCVVGIFDVIDDEFDEWAWSCKLTSFWPAAATVGIPASLSVLAVLKPQRLKADRARKQLLFLAGGPDNAFDDDVDEQPVQDLALNVDNIFQAEDCDASDSEVDEAPIAQTMFMANLSSADPITDEAGPFYDSNILSEVQDHDQYLDDTCAYQEEHVMHDNVQLDHVVDLHADHTSISNMIPYDQYVKENDVSIVYSNASSIPNDTFMMIYDDMCEPIAPSEFKSSRNAVVKNSLTAELATYREQVELYERRAKFELTEHNHARAKVHNSEDTLEIAEITRKKMNAKMTDPECVTHKVKIAPHDYSKENLLATFTPQKQLTPEQIYWSNDLMKLKSEALKEQAKVSRPIKAFTVYPSNTPATLVPRV